MNDRQPQLGLRPPRVRRLRAFTLMEVLIALAIFVVGMVGVAAIFPVGLSLQKTTIQDLDASQFANNARAMVETRGFAQNMIYQKNNSFATSMPLNLRGVILPGPDTMVNGVNPPYWSLADRSYDKGAALAMGQRTLFWVPLFFQPADTNPSPQAATDPLKPWKVYLFLVRNSFDANYSLLPSGIVQVANPYDPTASGQPGVPRVAEIAVSGSNNRLSFSTFNNKTPGGSLWIRKGNSVVTDGGTTMLVTKVDPNGAWIDVSGTAFGVFDIWAALPGSEGKTTFAGIVGPLTETKTPNTGTPNNDLVY